MRNDHSLNRAAGPVNRPHPGYYAPQQGPVGNPMGEQLARLMAAGMQMPRQLVVGVILTMALFAFEIFNFDTTRYALANLLGPVSFASVPWAAILAIAFCSIDFAGLVRLFTPEKGQDEPKEVWYLMGAWLLGATMNAMMTWWAISLSLLNHDFGNEVLSREQLLHIVPVFVAVLVWLTRILFIGAFSVAGERLLEFRQKQPVASMQPGRAAVEATRPQTGPMAQVDFVPTSEEVPAFLRAGRPRSQGIRQEPARPVEPLNLTTPPPQPVRKPANGRVKQRPPMPNGVRRTPLGGVQARGKNMEG